MNDSTPDPILPSAWRALLLHRLDEPAARALEQRLLEETGALEALQEAECDLFDDYARGGLTSEERVAFEQHRLNTDEARERLRFSRALAQASQSSIPAGPIEAVTLRRARFNEPRPRRRRGQIGIAVIGSALAAGLALAVVLLPRGLGIPGTSQQAANHVEPQTLVLLASVERGAPHSGVDVVLEPGATQLRVQAEIEQPAADAHYRLSVIGDGPSDRPLAQITGLTLQTAGRYRYVEAVLPSRLLADGPKTLRIEAEAPAAPFAFEWVINASIAHPG